MYFIQQKFSYLIIAVSLLLTLGTFLYGVKLVDTLQNLRASEVIIFQESRELGETLQEFQRALGFGGYIHNVKEYLIHRKPVQLFILETNVEELKTTFNRLQEHFSGGEPQQALNILDDFIGSVEEKYKTLRSAHGQRYSASELDELMGLERPEILSALVTLESLQDRDYQQSVALIQGNIDQLVHDVVMASFLLPIILAFGGLLVWMLNQAIAVKESLEKTKDILADNQRLLETTGQITKIGGWEREPKTGKEKWTREMYLLHGLQPEQYENPSWNKLADLYPSKSLASLEAALQSAQETGEPFDLKLPFNHPGKGERLARIVCQPALKNAVVVKLTGAFQDITEAELFEERLRQSEKMDSIGILAGGIAHDFNNILTGLYGNITLAKMKLAHDHPGFRFLATAEESMHKATYLTSQLLTFAKGGKPVKESLNLALLVEEVVNFNLTGSNVKPVFTLADSLWLASADHAQILQVFANLTKNARQAMPAGGHLHISMENAEVAENTLVDLDGGKYLRITVSDDGTGIAPEHLARIFELYFTTKQAGSGIGLATAHSIIKKHGGQISVTSQLGKGTTFILYLPASGLAEPPLKQVGTASASINEVARILVMDDEEMICRLLQEMLTELGFTVGTAAEGRQAIEVYRQAMAGGDPFAVVIVDLTVHGGMGGQETAKGILQIDPSARIIASSGYADDPVMANHTNYGFKGIVPKPYSLNKLSGVLTQVMEKV